MSLTVQLFAVRLFMLQTYNVAHVTSLARCKQRGFWFTPPSFHALDPHSVAVARRAQHVLAWALCDVATLQMVQTHGAVAKDAAAGQECCGGY